VTQAKNNPELTSTLHLGLRSIEGISHQSVLSSFLLATSAQEREAIAAIEESKGEKAMIFIHRGPAKGSRFLLASDGASIGRSPECSIFLDDITVSRQHASIEKVGSSFLFKDLGSLNGTYINNESVSEHLLVTGDEIQIGKFHMLFIGTHQQSTTGEK
jgi:hypothetical protein